MITAAWLAVAVAIAPDPTTFDVAPGPAVPAITRLASQAGVDVVITAPLSRSRVAGVRGRMTVEEAFDRLLRPVGARAVRIGPGGYRIEAVPAPVRRPTSVPGARSAAFAPDDAPAAPVQLSEVVVTAMPPVGTPEGSGRSLLDPGALARVEGTAAADAVSSLSATVDSTRQGAGRNKLFIRGLADSAMNGPVQATVGQYFGDLRLSSGSPHPDLALVDIRRIEVFEGPQGARFGVGSIGGVLRVTPEGPVPGETSGRLTLGGSATSGGAPGTDASLVLNTPVGETAALRLVAYGSHEGGYLDNPGLDLRSPDHVETVGGRAALQWVRGEWTFGLQGIGQHLDGADSQAVSEAGDRGVKISRVREPYASDFALAGLTASGPLGNLRLTSSLSASRQVLDERFDATAAGQTDPAVVDRRQTADTVAAEVRVDGGRFGSWRWTGGAALAMGETGVGRRRRELSADPSPISGADLTRTFTEAAVFGEASMSPAPDWRVAFGGRFSAVRIDSALTLVEAGVRTAGGEEDDGIAVSFTPSLSVRWEAGPALSLFGRLDQSVRPAGVNESSGAFARYAGDRVTLAEVGARARIGDRLSGEVSAGWVDWRDIQADIVTQGGDLVTDNIGDGVIRFLSIKGAWRATGALEVSGGLFLNGTRLTPTRLSVIGAGVTDIPNVAPVGAQLSLDHAAGVIAGRPLRLGADLRYVGASRLGVGPALDVPQGGYLRADLVARWGGDRRSWSLRISNPHDGDGIRYGIGSPYQLNQPQVIPVRPLTVRLGFDAAF